MLKAGSLVMLILMNRGAGRARFGIGDRIRPFVASLQGQSELVVVVVLFCAGGGLFVRRRCRRGGLVAAAGRCHGQCEGQESEVPSCSLSFTG